MLKPDADLPFGSWKVSASLGFLAILNSEPSQAMRYYLLRNFSNGNLMLNSLKRWRKAETDSLERC